MKKANRLQEPPAPLKLTAADIATIAAYLTNASDDERTTKLSNIQKLRYNIADNIERADSRGRDIAELELLNSVYGTEMAGIQREIDAMPVPVPVLPEAARADIARLAALPYIKSVKLESEGDDSYVIATTRANSLYTTLERKYSESERWYEVKPYSIPLPAYHIRVGLGAYPTLANKYDGLAIALADPKHDTAHFLPWISRYNHQVNPHWGTSSVSSYSDYKCVCLGEYESEVTNAMRRSIADGVIALAIYLQQSDATHGHIHSRHEWALWMGKAEYNALVVASPKEVSTLEPLDDECDCRNEDGDCISIGCECHND